MTAHFQRENTGTFSGKRRNLGQACEIEFD